MKIQNLEIFEEGSANIGIEMDDGLILCFQPEEDGYVGLDLDTEDDTLSIFAHHREDGDVVAFWPRVLADPVYLEAQEMAQVAYNKALGVMFI